MKKWKLLIPLLGTALVGCKGMSYEEVISRSKYCEKNGLLAKRVTLLDNTTVANVRCVDKDGTEYSSVQ